MSTNWSPLQNSIFDAVSKSSDNLIIEAVAGSGKTTTIVEAMRFVAASKPLFVAFNKSIATALESRIPPGSEAKTLNALGHRVVSKRFPRAKLDQWKVHNLIRRQGMKSQDDVRAAVSLVSFAKNCAIGITSEPSPDWFYDTLALSDAALTVSNVDSVARAARRAFEQSLDCTDIFDFDDQVYQPINHNLNPYERYDCIFVDEAQDLSPINHLALVAASSAGSRIIAVGDSHQAIYAFRGADSNSMRNMRERFSMQSLPLSITYRCPQAVVKVAQQYCPHIQAAEGAPEGSVQSLDRLADPTSFLDDDLILCRNNAPLFSLALEFIKINKPIRLQTNLGKDVINLIEKLDGESAQEGLASLVKWRDEKLDGEEPGSRLSSEIWDRFNCIKPFFDSSPTASKYAIVEKIRDALDSKRGTTISTIHRAKGSEARRVFFEQPELLGDEGQELNLYYVAVTRSAQDLFLHSLEAPQQ